MKKPNILELRPTQFVLGMKEIEFKLKKIHSFSKKELIAYCDDHVIPVIIGPRSEPYMIDHHHFARACWEMDVGDYQIKILKDLSDHSEKDFWKQMIQSKWTYLLDQFGSGPHDPLSLPADIRCMADDPYRSLAWAVLMEDGIKKMDVPFFEFQWAALFRKKLNIVVHSKSDFKEAIQQAMVVSKSTDAKHLPGFLG